MCVSVQVDRDCHLLVVPNPRRPLNFGLLKYSNKKMNFVQFTCLRGSEKIDELTLQAPTKSSVVLIGRFVSLNAMIPAKKKKKNGIQDMIPVKIVLVGTQRGVDGQYTIRLHPEYRLVCSSVARKGEFVQLAHKIFQISPI